MRKDVIDGFVWLGKEHASLITAWSLEVGRCSGGRLALSLRARCSLGRIRAARIKQRVAERTRCSVCSVYLVRRKDVY